MSDGNAISKFPDWIPPEVQDFYPYKTNIVTKKVMGCNEVFTEKESRLLWERVVLAYEYPRIYLNHITSAYFEAKEVIRLSGGAKSFADDYLEIKEDLLALAEKIGSKKRLDNLYIDENLIERQQRFKGLMELFDGNEYLAEEALSESLDHMRISTMFEYIAHRSGEMSESVNFIHSFANSETHAFSRLLFRELDGDRGDEYKIISLSILAIYKLKDYDASKNLAPYIKNI